MRKMKDKIPLIFLSSGVLVLSGIWSYLIYTINNVIGIISGMAIVLLWIGMLLCSIKAF